MRQLYNIFLLKKKTNVNDTNVLTLALRCYQNIVLHPDQPDTETLGQGYMFSSQWQSGSVQETGLKTIIILRHIHNTQ